MSSPTTTAPSLPIIDISPFLSPKSSETAQNKTAQALYDACHDVGFFYLTGHGIPEETQQAVLNAAREFFLNASEEEKALITRKEVDEGGDGARGWQKLGENVTEGLNVGTIYTQERSEEESRMDRFSEPFTSFIILAVRADFREPWLTPTRIGMKSTPSSSSLAQSLTQLPIARQSTSTAPQPHLTHLPTPL